MEEQKNSFISFLLKEFSLLQDKLPDHDLSPEISELKKYSPAELKRVIAENLSDDIPMTGVDWDDKHSASWKEEYIKHYKQALLLGEDAIATLKNEKKNKEPAVREKHELYNVMPKHHMNWFTELAIGSAVALVFAVMLSVFAPQITLRSLAQIDKMIFAPIAYVNNYINMSEDYEIFKVAQVDRGLNQQRKSDIIKNRQANFNQTDVNNQTGRVLGVSDSIDQAVIKKSSIKTFFKQVADFQVEMSGRIAEKFSSMLTQ